MGRFPTNKEGNLFLPTPKGWWRRLLSRIRAWGVPAGPTATDDEKAMVSKAADEAFRDVRKPLDF